MAADDGASHALPLKDVRHWFLDLDGTVYLGDTALPGALDLIRAFVTDGVGYTFLTNNSSKSSSEYVQKLRRLGFPVEDDGVVTSGGATAGYLSENHPDARVYLLGTPALAAELGARGVNVVENDPDTIVLGFDPQLPYERLIWATRHLRNGCRYVATHPDVNCPTADGFIPDAGSVVALVEASTGRRPDAIVGKPNVAFLRQAAARAGADLATAAMVGDRLETDLEMAQEAGIAGALVFSGATRPDDERLVGSDGTLATFAGLHELYAHLSGARTGAGTSRS